MKIDPNSGIPLYQQIVDRLKAAVRSGRYRTGDRIPPVRELAVALVINPNTVAKAYRILQEEGWLEARPGGGTFIAPIPEEGSAQEREAALQPELNRLFDQAEALGIDLNRLSILFSQEKMKREAK